MIYFSELKGKKVFSEDDVYVGCLEDLVFQTLETASISKLVIRGFLKEKLIIPIHYLKKINTNITIAKEYLIGDLEENELFILKNLLDKQIIDLKGNKVVRVNDVAIQDKGELYITGVDIGILGILRWFKLEDIIYKLLSPVGFKLTSQFLSWGDIQPLELVHGEVKLKKKEEKLQRIRPEDLADYLERTNIINARKFLKILDEKKAAEVIDKLNMNYRATLFKHYKPEKAAKFLKYIEPDDSVDILLTLPQKRRIEIIKYLPEKRREELLKLMKYSTSQIGGLITSDFITVYPDNLVKEVIQKIRKETGTLSLLNNIYVINKEQQLIGVFNLHELLLQDDETPIYMFMLQNVIVFHLTTPPEIALIKMLKYKLQAVPVIDEDKRILGMITIADLIETFKNKIV